MGVDEAIEQYVVQHAGVTTSSLLSEFERRGVRSREVSAALVQAIAEGDLELNENFGLTWKSRVSPIVP